MADASTAGAVVTPPAQTVPVAPTNKVARFFLGLTVVALYVVFVLSVAFGFGSYMYRSTWETEAPRPVVIEDGKTTAQDQSIDNMVFILRREKTLELEKDELDKKISDLNTSVGMKEAEVRLSYGPIARSKEQARISASLIQADLAAMVAQVDEGVQAKFDVISADKAIGPHGRVTALLDVVEAGLPATDDNPELVASFVEIKQAAETKMETLLRETEFANKASHDKQQEKQVIEGQIAALKDRQGFHDEQIEALRKVLPIESATRARLSSLELEIKVFGFQVLPADLVQRLVSFPTIFLTLVVTIAAGGLGTVVAFSRRYYDVRDEKLNASRLFVNVGEGIAAAIAIFLFSGAGMLALTQGGGTTSDVELSPYTVAFVAFVSGFMAEDAFDAIRNAGKNIFKNKGGVGGGAAPKGQETVKGDDTVTA